VPTAPPGCRERRTDDITASACEQQQAVLTCRSAFVVTEIEVTGHVDLPNPFGF